VTKGFKPARSSLGQQVVDYLRESIYSGEIAPDTHLNAVDIANQLGVSRSPVRDAMLTLTAEGLVEQLASSGHKVIQFDEKLIHDVFTIRLALETVALRQGMKQFDLNFINSQMNFWAEVANEDFSSPLFREAYVQADNKLHETIVETSQNKLLREVLEKVIRLGIAIRHWQHKQLFVAAEIIVTAQEHIAIFDAIKAGDVDHAVEALSQHIENSQHRALSRFEGFS